MSPDKEKEKSSKREEFLSIGNQYLSFADNLFNKYKTLYNEQQIIAKGKAGTVMLVDTSGFHKGGRCTIRYRKLFTSTFSLTKSFTKSKRKTFTYFDNPIISSLLRQ